MKGHIARKLFFALMAFIVTLIAGGCGVLSADFNVKIGMGEKWTFQAQIVPVAGYENEIYNQFNQIANDPETQSIGVDVAVKMLSPLPDGTVPIELNMKGTGYDVLNDMMGEDFITVDESTTPHTLYIQSSMGMQYMLNSMTFTVSGGPIQDHNGQLVNNKTVTWTDYPGIMSATMKEPSFLDYGWVIGLTCVGLAAVLVFLVSMLAVRRMKRKTPQHSPQTGVRPLVTAKKCVQCGSVIPIQADFCTNCGSRQN